MSKHNDLEELFYDIADAIREQTDTEELIKADNFPDGIRSIEKGVDVDLSLYAPIKAPVFQDSIVLGDLEGNGRIAEGANCIFVGRGNFGEGTNSLTIGETNVSRGNGTLIVGSNNEIGSGCDNSV